MDEPLDPMELIDNNAQATVDNFAMRMFNPQLAALRAQNPFIDIMPFPNATLAYLLTANTAQDVNLPSGTKLIRFTASGDFYATRKGAAQIPTGVHDVDGSGSILNPTYTYFYVEEINQLSIIAAAAVKVTVHCFLQL